MFDLKKFLKLTKGWKKLIVILSDVYFSFLVR